MTTRRACGAQAPDSGEIRELVVFDVLTNGVKLSKTKLMLPQRDGTKST